MLAQGYTVRVRHITLYDLKTIDKSAIAAFQIFDMENAVLCRPGYLAVPSAYKTIRYLERLLTLLANNHNLKGFAPPNFPNSELYIKKDVGIFTLTYPTVCRPSHCLNRMG